MALLDSGCTKGVCDERVYDETWFQQVKLSQSENLFIYGDNKMIESLRKIQFLINIAGVSATMTNVVVANDISLHLSIEAMKKANTKIDFQQEFQLFLEKLLI